MKKLNKVAMLFASAALATAAGAQTVDNWKNGSGDLVWKNGTNELCWRDANWTPATAAPGCDGALAAPAPAPAAAPAAPAAAPAAPAAKPAAPAAKADNGGIPGEVIAAISAAVATVMGSGAVIHGIRRVSKPAAGSRRGSWGDAGVREHTTPFM